MSYDSLDARALGAPGGIGEGIGNALRQSILAYFQGKDNQMQGERQMRQDERSRQRQQLADALAQAQSLGVGPSQENAGWLSGGDNGAIAAALKQHAERQQMAQVNNQSSLLSALAAGHLDPSQVPPGMIAPEIAATLATRAKQNAAAADASRRGQLVAGLQSGEVSVPDAVAAGIHPDDAQTAFAQGYAMRAKKAWNDAQAAAANDQMGALKRENLSADTKAKLAEAAAKGAPRAQRMSGTAISRLADSEARAAIGLPGGMDVPIKPEQMAAYTTAFQRSYAKYANTDLGAMPAQTTAPDQAQAGPMPKPGEPVTVDPKIQAAPGAYNLLNQMMNGLRLAPPAR